MKKKILKTFSVIFCISMVMLSSGCKKDAESKEKKTENIKIICEDTVLPMVNDLVRDYNLNNEPVVTVESASKESALNKLSNAEADVLIGYVPTENKEIKTEMIALDGIGIIVNPSNKVNTIGIEELKKIYTGNIANWENLKGESKEIVPVAYQKYLNSIQQEFDSKIMETPVKEQMSSNMKYVSSVEEMKNYIAQNKNAIGFIPGQWYNKENKFLKISGIEITMSNLKNELYSLRLPIKLYYPMKKEESLKDLFQYFKSEDGKKIIRKYCIEAF